MKTKTKGRSNVVGFVLLLKDAAIYSNTIVINYILVV